MSTTKTDIRSNSAKKSGSKIEKVIVLMRRKNGASLDEMIKATGWLPHTTRAALSGLRKKGHRIVRTMDSDVSRYTIESLSA